MLLSTRPQREPIYSPERNRPTSTIVVIQSFAERRPRAWLGVCGAREPNETRGVAACEGLWSNSTDHVFRAGVKARRPDNVLRPGPSTKEIHKCCYSHCSGSPP